MLPEPLLASGYPIDQIVVARYPVDAIDLTLPISFLGLSSETYEANRAAVRTLAPRVSVGGVIAVDGNENTPRAAVPGCVRHRLDAVAEFLKAQAPICRSGRSFPKIACSKGTEFYGRTQES